MAKSKNNTRMTKKEKEVSKKLAEKVRVFGLYLKTHPCLMGHFMAGRYRSITTPEARPGQYSVHDDTFVSFCPLPVAEYTILAHSLGERKILNRRVVQLGGPYENGKGGIIFTLDEGREIGKLTSTKKVVDYLTSLIYFGDYDSSIHSCNIIAYLASHPDFIKYQEQGVDLTYGRDDHKVYFPLLNNEFMSTHDCTTHEYEDKLGAYLSTSMDTKDSAQMGAGTPVVAIATIYEEFIRPNLEDKDKLSKPHIASMMRAGSHISILWSDVNPGSEEQPQIPTEGIETVPQPHTWAGTTYSQEEILTDEQPVSQVQH